MDTAPISVGIDVAKDQLDVALGSDGETRSVGNNEAGIRTLLGLLQERSCELIVLEATGGYEVPVVSALAAAGLPVAVINPRQPDDAARLLDALLTRRRQITDMIVAEHNRMGFAPAPLKKAIEKHIRWLRRELDDIDSDSVRPFRTAPSGAPKRRCIEACRGSAPSSRVP